MLKFMATAVLSVSLVLLQGCASPRGPKYQNVRSFNEGLAPVQLSNGRWGYINDRHQWVIAPKFEDAKEFQGGKAPAKQNGRWGFVNRNGEWL